MMIRQQLRGVCVAQIALEMYVMKAIPTGYKATHVHVYASHTITNGVNVYLYNHNTGVVSSNSTGNTKSTIDITDITSSATDNILIKVAPGNTGYRIYGADITITAV